MSSARTNVRLLLSSNSCSCQAKFEHLFDMGREDALMARKITKRQQQIYDFHQGISAGEGLSAQRARDGFCRGPFLPQHRARPSICPEARATKRDATKPRALELFNEDGSSVSLSKSDEPTAPRGTVSLPLVGRVAAGIPILAEQNIEDTFTIPTEIATDQGSFILEVHGAQ